MFLHLLERLIQRWTLHTTQTLTVASDQVSGAKAHRLTSSITLLGLVSEAQIDLLVDNCADTDADAAHGTDTDDALATSLIQLPEESVPDDINATPVLNLGQAESSSTRYTMEYSPERTLHL